MGTESLKKTFAQIRAAKAGDREAMNDLLTRYLPFVRKAVRQQVGPQLRHRDSLTDVLQESLLDACRGIHRFDDRDGSSFRSWLVRIVLNNVRDHARRRGRRVSGAQDSQRGRRSVSSVAARTPRPSQVARARELEEHIAKAMQRLPPLHRQIVELRAQGRLT